MSKALKQYARSYATSSEEISKFFSEMKGDSARGSVAAMSALIEEQLANAIKLELFLDEEEEADLFEGTGPLATFSARISFGFALGLYGRKAKRDLNLVREIRNPFVHSRRHIDFQTPEVVDLCRTFYCSSSIFGFKEVGADQQFKEVAIRVIQYASRNTYSGNELYRQMVGSFPEYQQDNEEIEKKKERRAIFSQPHRANEEL